MSTLIDRLLAKFYVSAESGCWEWSAGKFDTGYGAISEAGKLRGAHRVSYEFYHGPIPDGIFVLHHCDNPGCINPEHLFLGTHADNMDDRHAKGRQSSGAKHREAVRRGETAGRAKLTEADVLAIRAMAEHWGVITKLAKQYSVSHTQISHIRSGKRWTHIPKKQDAA